MPEVPTGRVGRTALTLTPIAILARGVAFLVPVLIAHLFDVTGVTDAFFYALAFPTVVMVLIANAVGTVATPLLAEVQETAPAELGRFVGGTATVAALCGVVFGALVLLALWPALPWVSSFDAPTRAWTWWFVAELLPFMALTTAGVILRAGCEIRGRFVPVALAPLLRGGTVMLTIWLGQPLIGPHALPLGLVLGDVVQTVWYVGTLVSADVVPVPGIALDHRLARLGRDALPLLAGEVLVALNTVVDKAFAANLDTGSVTLLEYADRARFIPTTLFESTLLPVAFATWANLAAQGRKHDLAAQIDQALRWIAALTAAPLAGLYIGRHVLTAWLYQHGEFTAADAQVTAEAFGWYLPGLWSMMLGTLAMRAHVVLRRLWLIFGLGVVSVVLNALLNAVLMGPMGIDGLALASSLVWWVVPAGYLIALAPDVRGAVRPAQWAPVLGIALVAALIAFGVELGGWTPTSLTDPALWLAALPCFALLGVGLFVTRPPRGAA